MKKFYRFIFPIIIITLLVVNGCAEKPTPSLFADVPTGPIGVTPTVSSITPQDSALSGITTLTITGANFSSDPTKDLVYFNGRPVKIISSTSTTIDIQAPLLLADTVGAETGNFEVSTLNAEKFSNQIPYKVNASIYQFFLFSNTLRPYDFVIDQNSVFYVSMTNEIPAGLGVKKLVPGGALQDYASKGLETNWNAMRLGPGGIIYTVLKGTGAVFQIPAGGGKPATYKALPNVKARMATFDIDALNNIWLAGDDTAIYKIKPDKSLVTYLFKGNITAVRFFNNSLYAAIVADSQTTIQSFPVDANGNLGNAALYYDYSKDYGTESVNAIEFSADGDMYLATNNVNSPIVVVHQTKASEILFNGTLPKAPALFMYWGSNGYLYYTRGVVTDATNAVLITQTILRLSISKQGAPYYGQ